MSQHSKCSICAVTIEQRKVSETIFLLDTYDKIVESGKYNYEGCKILVNKKLNIDYLRTWLS